jgi:ketol-acid reductoisomerase
LAKPAVQRRSFVAAANTVRVGATAAPKAAVSTGVQQKRGKKTIDFAGVKEVVYGMCAQAAGV